MAVQHVGLPDKQAVAERKDYWADRFAALAAVLERLDRHPAEAGVEALGAVGEQVQPLEPIAEGSPLDVVQHRARNALAAPDRVDVERGDPRRPIRPQRQIALDQADGPGRRRPDAGHVG